MLKKILIFIGILVFIQGCATPFSQFYYDQTGGLDITTNPRVIISNDEPKLFLGNDQEKDFLAMMENGFMMVGYSSFNAGNVDQNGAIRQAKKVKASTVLLYSKYTNTVSGVLPLTLPDTQTSSMSLYGNIYGSGGGYATYSGTANTTTYGSKTTYIPYNVNRADYLATYWVKAKPPIFGTFVLDLTQEIRDEMQSNNGVLVAAVIKGSPAFRSDILKEDVILKIENTELYDPQNFGNDISKYAGQKVNVILYRNGEILKKEIQLNKEI